MTNEYDPARGQRIRERREQRRLDKTHVARLVGVSPRTVYSWEDGKAIRAAHLGNLADVLEVSIAYIATGGAAETPLQEARRRLGELETSQRETVDRLSKLEDAVPRLAAALEDLVRQTPGLPMPSVADRLPGETTTSKS